MYRVYDINNFVICEISSLEDAKSITNGLNAMKAVDELNKNLKDKFRYMNLDIINNKDIYK